MIDHTGIGVRSVPESAKFYDAVLGQLGMTRCEVLPPESATDGIGYGIAYPVFWIDKFHPYSTKNHTAFAAKSKAEVEAFYKAGLENGGRDNGKPGYRGLDTGYPEGYYAAFLFDPDGNNIEAVFRERR